MTIEEGNLIIAKYDGWQWESEEWNMLYKISDGFWYSDKYEDCILDEAEYRSNWQWLMPVVKKLMEDLYNCRTNPTDKANRELVRKLNKLEIEPLWEETIKGIQVLNELKHAQEANNNNRL